MSRSTSKSSPNPGNVNIRGKIEYVNKSIKGSNGKWSPKSFMVRVTPPDRKQPLVLCTCESFCDPMPHDTIVGVGVEGVANGKRCIQLSRQPFLIPSSEKDGIVKIIEKVMEKVYWDKPSHKRDGMLNPGTLTIKAERMFDSIRRNFESDVQVLEYLDKEAENSREVNHPMVGDYDRSRFARIWYEISVMRRIYAIGITKLDLKNFVGSKIQLYKDIATNPYKVVFLTIEKCNYITMLKGEKVDPNMVAAGHVIRYIYDRYKNNNHMFVPASELEAVMDNNYSMSKQLLYDEFNVVFEDAGVLEGDKDSSEDGDNYILKSPICRTKLGLVTLEEPRPNAYTLDHDLNIVNVYMNSNYQIELLMGEYPIMMSRVPPLPPTEIFFTRSDLSTDQTAAINHAYDHRLSIITGGAGTGKTTIINELYYNNKLQGRNTAIVSFTGRAAAVLRNKVMGSDASTVHRYLSSQDGPVHLIIDEASMLAAHLFYELLVTFPSIEHVTLVGDDNQLLPIEAGAFFHQYVESGNIPTYRLTENHRVKHGDDSGIINNAKLIARSGRDRPVILKDGKNFHIKDSDEEDVGSVIDRLLLYNNKNPKNAVNTRDLTVICPLREQVSELNRLIQSKFRTGEYMYIGSAPMKVYVEDRVMMLSNDYDVGIFNGEEGYVVEINPEEHYIIVDFIRHDGESKLIKVIDDSEMEPWESQVTTIGGEYGGEVTTYKSIKSKDTNTSAYGGSNRASVDTIRASAIEHSYANTPHKYQGSESKYVIVALPDRDKPSPFMCKNLLYTAITRARMSLTLCGKRKLINAMASYSPNYGYDNTSKRLNLALPYIKEEGLEPVEHEEWDECSDYEVDYDEDDYDGYCEY